MISVACAGTADRIIARTLFNVLRAGSGTPARYSSTLLGAVFLVEEAGARDVDFFMGKQQAGRAVPFPVQRPLLLVVHHGARNLLSRGISSVNRHRAGFAIGRYYGSTGKRDLPVFLTGES